MHETEFEIDRKAVKKYFLAERLLATAAIAAIVGTPISAIMCEIVYSLVPPLPVLLVFVHWLVLMFVVCGAATLYLLWLCQHQANSLRCRLEGSTLRVSSGVFFLYHKSIPLERISDVALVQGPLLRFFGIWEIRVQTSGTAYEAKFVGVCEPENVREQILSHRRCACHEKTNDA
jgi:membrane protein YdbS with pleckstrin-like domain